MPLSGSVTSHLTMAACGARQGTAAQQEFQLPRFADGKIRRGLR
jgi:hypothetical protein